MRPLAAMPTSASWPLKPEAARSAAPCSGESSDCSLDLRRAVVAAGDQALKESWGDGEGRGNFAGVEDAETAAGAGADVEDAATVLYSLGDLVDCFRDFGE